MPTPQTTLQDLAHSPKLKVLSEEDILTASVPSEKIKGLCINLTQYLDRSQWTVLEDPKYLPMNASVLIKVRLRISSNYFDYSKFPLEEFEE